MRLFSRVTKSAVATAMLSLPATVTAQVYNGGGINAGVAAAGSLGLSTGNPFYVLLNVIRIVLNLMGIVAMAAIIIAGIYMIISLGNDEQIDKAKKIIKYTLIGLIIILFSRILVGLVTHFLYSAV